MYIILANVVGNALKFTRTGSVHVFVSVTGEGDQIEFQIQDSGIGIPKAQEELPDLIGIEIELMKIMGQFGSFFQL